MFFAAPVMKNAPVLGLLFGIILLLPQKAPAHGLGYAQLEAAPAVALQFSYSTGEPLAYAALKVYAPGNDKIEYQNGRTDAAGCFSFIPNVSGVWRLLVTDGQGHALEAEITVGGASDQNNGPEARIPQAQNGPAGLPLWLKAALGVSLLLNIYAACYFMARRKYKAVRDRL